MKNHKTKPKLKKYIKAGFHVKRKKILFFSPDFSYLNSKISTKIEDNFKLSMINLRKLKLLFGFYKTSNLKKIIRYDLPKKKTSYILKEVELCSFLERRLDFVLFRLGLVKSLFEAKHLIAYKKIFVNGQINNSYTQRLKKGDIISFHPSTKRSIFNCLLKEITQRPFFFNTCDNIEINFKTLNIIVLSEKLKFSNQIQHYSILLNWKFFLGK